MLQGMNYSINFHLFSLGEITGSYAPPWCQLLQYLKQVQWFDFGSTFKKVASFMWQNIEFYWVTNNL